MSDEIKYRVLQSNSLMTLERGVSASLELDHWKLEGGICVSRNLNGPATFYQAIGWYSDDPI